MISTRAAIAALNVLYQREVAAAAEAYEAGNRAAEDDETELRRAWAPAELRELKGSEHGNERVTPVTPNDGDAP